MGIVYGGVIALVALAVIVLTAWAVDRLDSANRGPKSVAWRPWWRTAIASSIAERCARPTRKCIRTCVGESDQLMSQSTPSEIHNGLAATGLG